MADVTELRRAEQATRFLAYHDALTGLPNRRLLDDRLRQAIRLAQRRDRMVATLLVHLDDFRQVNDTLGHGAGDARAARGRASAWRAACARRTRWRAPAPTSSRSWSATCTTRPTAAWWPRSCRRRWRAEFRVGGRRLRLAASIGVSLYPADGGDGEALLRNADAAMYRARQIGRNQVSFFGR